MDDDEKMKVAETLKRKCNQLSYRFTNHTHEINPSQNYFLEIIGPKCLIKSTINIPYIKRSLKNTKNRRLAG